MDLRYEEAVYTKPPGADFWDGYRNQPIVLIDDMGQNSDDEEWKDFCQLVSSAPLRLNMADIAQKGIFFTSPIIICTSNLEKPCPKTLYTAEAVQRRLKHKFEVWPVEDCGIPLVGGDNRGPRDLLLDVPKARGLDMFKDMSCVNIMDPSSRKHNIRQIADMILAKTTESAESVKELIDAFSQGDEKKVTLKSLYTRLKTSKEERKVSKAAVKKKFKKSFASVKNHLKRHWRLYALGGALVCGVIGAGVAMYRTWNVQDTVMPEGAYAGVQTRPIVKNTPVSESATNIAQLVMDSLVRVGVGKSGNPMWKVNGLGIKDDKYLIPNHVFIGVPDTDYLFLEKHGVIYEFLKSTLTVYTFDTSYYDAVLVVCPGMPATRDITKHFVKENQLNKCVGNNASGIMATKANGVQNFVTENNLTLLNNFSYQHPMDSNLVTVKTGRTVKGVAVTTVGMCGGGLVSTNTSVQVPILGIHVAGGNGHAYAAVVTFEMLENVLTTSQMMRMARVEKAPRILPSVAKTTYERTQLAEFFPVNKQPAVLSVNDKRTDKDFGAVMLSKYDKPIVPEPKGFSVVVAQVALNLKIMMRSQNWKEGLLSPEQAAFGIEGLDEIDKQTSPGLPFIFDLTVARKTKMMDYEEKKIGKFLEDRVERMMDDILKKRTPDVTFATFPKDEMRPLEKIALAKTRAIDGSPLDYCLCFRQLLGNAIAFIQSNPGFGTGSAVGIYPERDWNHMFRHLCSECEFGFDLDYTQFDSTLQPYMLFGAGQILGSMTGLSDDITRSLMTPLVHSRHHFRDMIYYVNGSMPSGSPATSVLNSLCNLCVIKYAVWTALGIDPIMQDQYIMPIVYGDDVLVGVKRGKEKEVDVIKIKEKINSMGLIVTSGDKNSEICLKKLSELVFLKRRAVMDEKGEFHPAIDPETIRCLLHWKRKGATLEENIHDALWFAAQHGKEFYEELLNEIQGALEATSTMMTLPVYGVMDARFRAVIEEETKFK